MDRKIIVLLVSFLSLLVIAGTVYYFSAGKRQETFSFENLVEKNLPFRDAMAKFETQDWKEAEPLLSAALLEARTPEEEAQIKAKLAFTKHMNGDIPGAIALFKEIAADAGYSRIAHAYAVEYMALMYVSYGTPGATEEIFKDEPYESLYDPNDISLSYRKLFEYASSFYPLALSEAWTADWYANRILMLLSESKNPPEATLEEIEGMKGIVRGKLANVDRDLARIKNIPEVSFIVPGALLRKAIVAGKLVIAGDASLGDPEKMFEEALLAHRASGGYDAYALYHYAYFLARAYGEERKKDVRALLSNFYRTDAYRDTFIFSFFAPGKESALVRERMALLARLDPEFKKLLVELGWKF